MDLERTLPVLLDYFDRHGPEALIGQTLAIHFALIPRLYAATGVHFELTVGWIVRQGKPLFQHDETLIRVFLREKLAAWQRLGVPFHLWLTSPALEILDVTFAMNCGWAKSREDCSRLILYRCEHHAPADPVYHPTIVGPDFFEQTGVVI
ncbi:MAG TPA: hypothetical protein VKV16_01870 [Solirubrobacteraceae bacterium]|nr:hypothetical protein [Solirubrobacteraceae bacterium]